MSHSFVPPRHLYYDGKIQIATSGNIFRSIDPSTAEPLADVHEASHPDIDSAIQSARQAFSSWSITSPIARSRILARAVQLLRERNDEIARIETRDTGKPYSETSTVDVATGADVLEYYANLVGGGGLNGETVQLREDAWVYTKKEPLGVCAGIGAWNYPVQMYATRQRHMWGLEVTLNSAISQLFEKKTPTFNIMHPASSFHDYSACLLLSSSSVDQKLRPRSI